MGCLGMRISNMVLMLLSLEDRDFDNVENQVVGAVNDHNYFPRVENRYAEA